MEWLARSAPGPIRLWAARKAADRAMHWAALRGGAEDPYVLARLGLYGLAADRPARDEMTQFGHLLARASRGEHFAADRLTNDQRRLLARTIAPVDADFASRLLPEDAQQARAACLLAMGETITDRGVAGPAGEREAQALRAAIDVRQGDQTAAREAINAMLAIDGVAPILEPSEASFAIGDLASAELGDVEGPLVSVIIPYRNAEDTLGHAVRSILMQSWRNIEVLLVDDRSDDRSAAVARELAEADRRVRLLENSRTPGVYGARNTAIEAATGDYITFLDADDWSPAERIARQMERLGDGAVCIANHIRMDEHGAPVAPRVFPIVRMVPITMLLRRETLLAAGPFEEVPTGADSEMFARLEMLHGKSAVRRDPAVLLVARWRSGSLSDAAEGGMLGAEREAYRADWMFRHAGLKVPGET